MVTCTGRHTSELFVTCIADWRCWWCRYF